MRPCCCGRSTHQPLRGCFSAVTILGSEIREREDDLCNNDTMDAALSMRERALQRGRHTRAATKTTRVAETEDKTDAGATGMRRDGRSRQMLGISLRKTRGEGRDVMKTGPSRCVGFGGWMYPTPNVV